MPEPQYADDLYALSLGDFIAARNALAKRLKVQGRGDEAGEVARLRKPPLTAWALNQVARHHKSLVQDVLSTGRQLKESMAQTLEGDRTGYADAREAERRAIDLALEQAVRCHTAAGRPPTDEAKQRMAETLRAATVEDDVAELLRRGALDSDKSAVGFGFGLAPTPAGDADRHTHSSRTAGSSRRPQPLKERERRRKRLVAEIEEMTREGRDARRAADHARREADRLAARAAQADGKLAEAERRLETLDAEGVQ